MKPAPFKYFAPETTDEVFSLLTEYGYDAKLLAGGQSLIPTMNFRLAQPAVLIDLNRINSLSFINKDKKNGLRIGAMTRQSEVENSSLIAKHSPLISETMPHIAHPQIRNRGTIGGTIAHADPSAELPAVMVALNARFLLQNKKEERWVSANNFFVDLFTTALEPEDILTEIVLPSMPLRSGFAFREVARRHGDYALVGVAAVVTLNNKDECKEARIVFLSVGNGPVNASQAAQTLLGKQSNAKIIEDAAKVAAEKEIEPPDDIHASSEFRRHLAKVLTKQALELAFKRAKS